MELAANQRMELKGTNSVTESSAPTSFLRTAGQYLRAHRERALDDRLVPYFLVIFTFWMVCIVEFTQKIGGQTLDPRFWMFLAMLVTIYGGFKVFRLRSQLQSFATRHRKDREVGHILDRVRAKGFITYDRLPETEFQVDHIVVGPSGIYVIETKERTVFGSRTIDYVNDNQLILGGKITDSQPLKKTRGAADAIRRQLQEHLHQQFAVKPLVVFSGEWRVNRYANDVDVAVVTANQLESYLDREQPELTSKEITQICSHFERSL